MMIIMQWHVNVIINRAHHGWDTDTVVNVITFAAREMVGESEEGEAKWTRNKQAKGLCGRGRGTRG